MADPGETSRTHEGLSASPSPHPAPLPWAPRLPADAGDNAVLLSWLIRLRWGAGLGYSAAIWLVAGLWGVPLRLEPLIAVVATTLATNTVVFIWVRRRPPPSAGLARVLLSGDFLLLTVMLYYTGGASSPMVVFYFVNLALAAVIVDRTTVLALVALVGGCLLFLINTSIPALDPALQAVLPISDGLYAHGMASALLVASAFGALFSGSTRRALSRREQELAQAEAYAARAERLAHLATLAGGAAHELATPLSTVAMVTKDLRLMLAGDPPELEEALEGANVIHREIHRCRDILARMSVQAGEMPGEAPEEVTCSQLLDEVTTGLSDPRVTLHHGPTSQTMQVPLRGLGTAIRSVLKNAQDATPHPGQITIRTWEDPGWIHIEIADRGRGMAPDVLALARAPFFTTKGGKEGMGLGLFLTEALLHDVGGHIALSSKEGAGTNALISIPAQAQS